MRLLYSLVMIGLASTPALSLFAQQLQQRTLAPPVPGPDIQSPNAVIGPSLIQPPATPVMPSDLGRRPAGSAPIRATGPALEPLLQVPTPQAGPLKAVSSRLLDPAGRPIPGVIRVAPNRVYDPGSGRYYRTVGSGPAEHVVP